MEMNASSLAYRITNMGKQRIFRNIGVCLLFATLAVLFLWQVVFAGKVLLAMEGFLRMEPWRSETPQLMPERVWYAGASDTVSQSYPLVLETQKAILNGQWPLWYPGPLGGISLLADRLSLYFLTDGLFLFLPAAQALSWTVVIHLFLAGIFTYAYLRELGVGHFGAIVGGITFAYSGHVIIWLIHFNNSVSMIWMPLMFWGVERASQRRNWRWSLVGGLAFAISLSGGDILRSSYIAIGFALLIFYRMLVVWLDTKRYQEALRIFSYGLIAGLFGMGLAAPRILATLGELYPLTVRASHPRFFGPHPLIELVRILVPDFYGNPVARNYSGFRNFTETHFYWGVIPLIFIFLSLASRYRRLAWGYVGIAFFFLLGVHGVLPFYQLLSLHPGFTVSKPGRVLHVVAFMGAVAAGFGATTLAEKYPKKFYQRVSVTVGTFAAGLIVLAISVYLLAPKGLLLSQLTTDFLGSLEANRLSVLTLTPHQITALQKLALFLLLTAVLFFWLAQAKKPRPGLLKMATLALITVDLFLAGIDYQSAIDPALLFPPTPSLEHLAALVEAESEPVRILGLNADYPNNTLPGDTSTIFGFQSVQGYTSFMPTRYARYVRLSGCVKHPLAVKLELTCADSQLLDALGAKYIYVSKNGIPKLVSSATDLSKYQEFDLAFDGPNQIYVNPYAFPRTWIVHQVIPVEKGDQTEVEKLLLAEGTNLRQLAIVEVGTSESPVLTNLSAGQTGSIDSTSRITTYQPTYVRVEATLMTPGYLVMSDNNYPGWQAIVDGQEQPIYYTNLFMRGVYLPVGEHIVEFVYTPQAFLSGLYIAGATLLLMLGGLIWTRRRVCLRINS